MDNPIVFVDVVFNRGPNLLELLRQMEETVLTPVCPCPNCHLKNYPLPYGYYDFEFEGVPLIFPTHRERLFVVGLHSKRVLLSVDGDKTSVDLDLRDIWACSAFEPVAVLHNHPDDFPIELAKHNEPSEPDMEAAHALDCKTLYPITHVVVTRDSGYVIYDGNGIIKQEVNPCSLSPSM